MIISSQIELLRLRRLIVIEVENYKIFAVTMTYVAKYITYIFSDLSLRIPIRNHSTAKQKTTTES